MILFYDTAMINRQHTTLTVAIQTETPCQLAH